MEMRVFELGPLGVDSYLILPDEGAILVDAPHESSEVIPSVLSKLGRKLDAILITHGHFDHVWDAGILAKKTGAKVYASPVRRDLLESPDSHSKYAFSGSFNPAKIDVEVGDRDELNIDGVEIKCFDVPGHCDGSVAYWLPKEKVVFVGDLIFRDSVGRTDLEGGDFSVLERSIKEKIYTLPGDTSIMPGHGERTSVEYEKKFNEYVRG